MQTKISQKLKGEMNVLSLFDDISCGRIDLERAGLKVDNCLASEIDKFAIQVRKHNHQDIKHIGVVARVRGSEFPKIDLLIGGSPWQGFSFSSRRIHFNPKERTKI